MCLYVHHVCACVCFPMCILRLCVVCRERSGGIAAFAAARRVTDLHMPYPVVPPPSSQHVSRPW